MRIEKTKIQSLLALVVVNLLLVTSCCLAQVSGNYEAETSRKLDEYIGAVNQMGPFSGAVLIARGGKILAEKAYGMADLEHDVPNTPQTKFRLASVTKQFTAMGIMILQELNKLNVQDSVCKYLTDCPVTWQPITLHHLLTHTSGVPNITALPDFKDISTLPTTPDKTIQRIKDKPLDFQPGEKFNYSNSGYIILGRVIEKVSGKSYEEFMKENIFEPLKMMNTGYDRYQTVLKNRALGYRWRGGFQHAPYVDMSIPFAAGGLYSTVEDMFLWDQALYTEKLVSKKTLDTIFTPVKENYGYGWIIGDKFNRKNIAHSGEIEGFKSVVSRYPDDKVYVVILSNIENINLSGIVRTIAAIALDEKYELPKPPSERKTTPAAAKIDPKIYDSYVGQYEFPMFVLSITRDGDKLIAQPSSGGPPAEMIPESETQFFIQEEEGSKFTFVKDEQGRVVHIEAVLRGQKFQGKKIK